MAEDLESNLATYKLQLQQVEAALESDSTSEELLKLQHDLDEVIKLTEDLISAQKTANPTPDPSTSDFPERKWAIGDKCCAPYIRDKCYYRGTLEDMLVDGTCTVTFTEYDHTEAVPISQLRPVEMATPRAKALAVGLKKRLKTKKEFMAAEREYKKKKQQKKAQRIKALEDEREGEKNKWLSFNSKSFSSKSSRGKIKKSIFATPEAVEGRVGVGTCDTGGKPMTSFANRNKWKK
ncbi:hypothetical protein CAPTEDRAFT_20281 [Capitella teleta]|uniref:Tudor domain-containing protein n=1 Tax=Capitella teleta TaxID=283909 RepID=R7UJ88_CAPTE|nr:hypothetical protein CAPTEDRAFT_20281 [Capitella teleta]|eukprot:ELU06148.1 hypothetical protein CAPTEDRAFT_20281 [Capitella teleta]